VHNLNIPCKHDRMLDAKVLRYGGLNDRHGYSECGGEETGWKRSRGVACGFILDFLMIRWLAKGGEYDRVFEYAGPGLRGLRHGHLNDLIHPSPRNRSLRRRTPRVATAAHLVPLYTETLFPEVFLSSEGERRFWRINQFKLDDVAFGFSFPRNRGTGLEIAQALYTEIWSRNSQ
jgi:hypothetical protein